jgi:hypothetical protein
VIAQPDTVYKILEQTSEGHIYGIVKGRDNAPYPFDVDLWKGDKGIKTTVAGVTLDPKRPFGVLDVSIEDDVPNESSSSPSPVVEKEGVEGKDDKRKTTTSKKLLFNMWSGFDYPGDDRPYSPELDGPYIEKTLDVFKAVCGDCDESYTWLMYHLASMFRNPNKTGVCCILFGDQGIGKDTALGVYGTIVGPNAYHVSTDCEKDIFGPFNSILATKLVVKIEELEFGSVSGKLDRLKSTITATTMQYNQKHEKNYNAPSFLNLFATTNSSVAVPIEPGDRRFVILHGNNRLKGKMEFWDSLNAELNSPTCETYLSFARYMKSGVPVPEGFSSRASRPITKVYREAMLSCRPWHAELLQNLVCHVYDDYLRENNIIVAKGGSISPYGPDSESIRITALQMYDLLRTGATTTSQGSIGNSSSDKTRGARSRGLSTVQVGKIINTFYSKNATTTPTAAIERSRARVYSPSPASSSSITASSVDRVQPERPVVFKVEFEAVKQTLKLRGHWSNYWDHETDDICE